MNPTLRIKSLEISDIGPFPDLKLYFKDSHGINLICGDNGVGKTTILEAITAAFSVGRNHRIKRRQAGEAGTLRMAFDTSSGVQNSVIEINDLDPKQGEFISAQSASAKNLIHIRTSRDIQYIEQTNISRDPIFDQNKYGQRVAGDLISSEIKSWFTNRYLLEPHSEKSSWTPQMLSNLTAAKSFFSLLDPEISLEEVHVTTFEIMMSTPNGTIPFELMSSGFRSTYFLLLSILKEIEFRKLDVAANEFSGVILVDEIDLHLHPSWQQEIGKILTHAFPKAQIIATTHSPHVIQTTDATDVISLRRTPDGGIERKGISTGPYGFKGWTVEEVLEEVMGVENTKTSVFQNAFREFDEALDEGNPRKVNSARAALKEMLHPQNPLRKLIEIQSAPFAFESREAGAEE
ncbi:MAG: AAA family ATPase [Nitratireductor sp.]|uniref:AAA family ATPase n=1 Tax=Nitratireductor sp. TaxID=1872084 RepID=UPI00261FC3A8|nr:AAA family ATPase [Nitratireductor sp.]MCV0352878.1 AAA family ATPase [Nitratireductor sp.]